MKGFILTQIVEARKAYNNMTVFSSFSIVCWSFWWGKDTQRANGTQTSRGESLPKHSTEEGNAM